jgi:hypothetical protein
MTGYESKKAAALDEDGMYLVHHTKRKDDDDDTQVYKDHGDALTIAYQSGYYDGKKAALKLALRDLENAELATDSTYESTALIRAALAQRKEDT